MENELNGGTTTYVYDAVGRVCSIEGPLESFAYDGAGPDHSSPPEPGEQHAARTAQPVLKRSLEFRLCGSEMQEQVLALDGFSGRLIATVNNLRAYLTCCDPSTVGRAIGGVAVGVALRGAEAVCTVRLTDFAPGDLVVVQVDVAVYALR